MPTPNRSSEIARMYGGSRDGHAFRLKACQYTNPPAVVRYARIGEASSYWTPEAARDELPVYDEYLLGGFGPDGVWEYYDAKVGPGAILRTRTPEQWMTILRSWRPEIAWEHHGGGRFCGVVPEEPLSIWGSTWVFVLFDRRTAEVLRANAIRLPEDDEYAGMWFEHHWNLLEREREHRLLPECRWLGCSEKSAVSFAVRAPYLYGDETIHPGERLQLCLEHVRMLNRDRQYPDALGDMETARPTDDPGEPT